MTDIPPVLVGTWEKINAPPCAAKYPGILQIESAGLFSARGRIPGQLMIWDDGTVRLLDRDRMAISTANDAIVTYLFRLEDDVIEFTDPDGCVFKYRRAL